MKNKNKWSLMISNGLYECTGKLEKLNCDVDISPPLIG